MAGDRLLNEQRKVSYPQKKEGKKLNKKPKGKTNEAEHIPSILLKHTCLYGGAKWSRGTASELLLYPVQKTGLAKQDSMLLTTPLARRCSVLIIADSLNGCNIGRLIRPL